MNPNLIIDRIKWYFHYQKVLSYLIILNLAGFIFLKENFFTLFFFIYFLFFFGSLFIKMLPERKMIISYSAGAIVGMLLFLSWQNNAFENQNTLIVSVMQSGILSILTAIASYKPNYKFKIFIFPLISLKYLTVILIILNLLSVDMPNVYLAHIGGCASGLVSGLFYRNYFSSFLKFNGRKKAKMKTEFNPKRPLRDDEYNEIKADKQKRTDAILDKISKSGYESLSKEEKEFLFKSGNN